VNNSYGHKNHKDFITVLVLVVLLDQWTLCECGFPHTSPRRSAFEMNKLIKAASRVGIDIGTSVKLPERANSRVEDFKQSGSGHLNLGDCGLDDNSVAAVLQVLKKADLLQSITKITLDSNAITKLPTDIGALEFVCDVSLQSNQLKSIPRTVLEKCRQMETLVLANNAITCMPEMEGTVRLNRLDVGNNRGFQLSATFATAMAPRLFALLMPSNMIQSFPTSVLLLHALRELDLHDNDLAVLPDSFSELPMLEVRRTWFGLMIVPSRIDVQTLDLSLNKIAELPPSLTHLKKLVTLKLRFGGCERGVYACVTGVQCMRACARCVCVSLYSRVRCMCVRAHSRNQLTALPLPLCCAMSTSLRTLEVRARVCEYALHVCAQLAGNRLGRVMAGVDGALCCDCVHAHVSCARTCTQVVMLHSPRSHSCTRSIWAITGPKRCALPSVRVSAMRAFCVPCVHHLDTLSVIVHALSAQQAT
jgi:hypothetical protein